jgi:hypothetical protein
MLEGERLRGWRIDAYTQRLLVFVPELGMNASPPGLFGLEEVSFLRAWLTETTMMQ